MNYDDIHKAYYQEVDDFLAARNREEWLQYLRDHPDEKSCVADVGSCIMANYLFVMADKVWSTPYQVRVIPVDAYVRFIIEDGGEEYHIVNGGQHTGWIVREAIAFDRCYNYKQQMIPHKDYLAVLEARDD